MNMQGKWPCKNWPHKVKKKTTDSTQKWREVGSQVSIHELNPMFETYNPAVFETHFEAQAKNTKSTAEIPHTVIHYLSPSSKAVAFSSEVVSTHMQSFGMDVIPIFGEEGEDHPGLILEHYADSETEQFTQLVEQIKTCLHHLGWNYDGWVGEDLEEVRAVH